MVEFVIRAAEPGDADDLTEIYNQRYVAANTLQLLYSPLNRWRERLQSPGRVHALVADAGGVIIGSAGLERYENRRAHAGAIGMSVHQEYQRKGVGTALLEALLDLADNWYNLRRVELEVYTDNKPAVALYANYGFEIEGTLRAYAFREGRYVDAFYMARLRDAPSLFSPDSGESQ